MNGGYTEYLGVRVDKSTYDWLIKEAARRRVSIAWLIRNVLYREMEARNANIEYKRP